jgi:hypothetical protein
MLLEGGLRLIELNCLGHLGQGDEDLLFSEIDPSGLRGIAHPVAWESLAWFLYAVECGESTGGRERGSASAVRFREMFEAPKVALNSAIRTRVCSRSEYRGPSNRIEATAQAKDSHSPKELF